MTAYQDGAHELIAVADALANLGISNVASLGWHSSRSPVVIHARSREDVDRIGDWFGCDPGREYGDVDGVPNYERRGVRVEVFGPAWDQVTS